MGVLTQTGLAVGAAAALLAAGCQPQRQAQLNITPVERSVGATPGENSSDQPATGTSLLAAQSQRDVEAILNARAAANARLQESPTTQPTDEQPRKAILWNDPKAPGKQKTSPRDAQQPALLRPLTPGADAAAPPAENPADSAATAKNPLEPNRLKTLMVELSRELYANGAYSQTPLRELMMIAAMSMIDPQRKLDPQAIPDLTEGERELLGKLQAFFADLGKSLDGGADTEKAIVEAVARLKEGLVKQPTLRLPTVALCTRVGGFGDYTQFEKYSFLAQSQQKAIVYMEIADFTSELNQKNEFVTQIAQQLIIYSERDGIPVWKEDWQTAVDVTKNKRQDFFTVQVITLPKALSVGKYQLKIRARDEKSGAEAESTISFELVADPRMAVVVGK